MGQSGLAQRRKAFTLFGANFTYFCRGVESTHFSVKSQSNSKSGPVRRRITF